MSSMPINHTNCSRFFCERTLYCFRNWKQKIQRRRIHHHSSDQQYLSSLALCSAPMASSSLALTALNFKPYPRLSTSSSPPSSWSGRGRVAARVRSEMKIYKGTHMREQRLTEMIEQKVMEAKQVCGEDETSDECKVAWDEVEEVSQAKADLRLKLNQLQQDPLENFCRENPETDECRIYED